MEYSESLRERERGHVGVQGRGGHVGGNEIIKTCRAWRCPSASEGGKGTHRMCVGAVGAEGQGDGRVEDAKLAHHLLHATDGALLVRVGKLDHQAGRRALREERIGASLRREGRLRLTSRFASETADHHTKYNS